MKTDQIIWISTIKSDNTLSLINTASTSTLTSLAGIENTYIWSWNPQNGVLKIRTMHMKLCKKVLNNYVLVIIYLDKLVTNLIQDGHKNIYFKSLKRQCFDYVVFLFAEYSFKSVKTLN